jgi:hypothetical protein
MTELRKNKKPPQPLPAKEVLPKKQSDMSLPKLRAYPTPLGLYVN